MNREEKKEFVANLHARLEKAKGTFLVHYKGLNVEEMNRLRNELRTVDTEFQVVKNRLLKLASQETETEVIQEHMEGPSGIVLTYDDEIATAKVLVNFGKSFSPLGIRIGQISGKLVEPEGIKRLAELPGKDVLLAQALSVMQAVPTSFVRVLHGIVAELLYVLRAIEEKKEDPPEASF